MLDGLSASEHAGIAHVCIFGFSDDFLCLFDDTLNNRARLGFRFDVDNFEHFVETRDVAFRLLKMIFESGF